MRKWVQLAILFVIGVGGLAAGKNAPLPALMPMPASVSAGQGRLVIDSSFSVRIGPDDQALREATERFISQVSRQTGIPIQAGQRATLIVDCRECASNYPTLEDDESYTLDVTPEGARLSAPSLAGVRHGMQTFLQLVAADAQSFFVPAAHIEDRPRFPWRGLMLDVSRHWMPLPVIRRNLDAMAAVKFNVFHWHLSDDQGFRVESKLFPKLQQLGSDGHFYTQDEIRAVIAYARDRGIRVIPEFDIPGHTTAWFVGYPELAAAAGPFQIERKWGIFEPTLDVSREEVYTFLDALVGEMAALFPDPYFHIGGDEVVDREWRESPAIQAFERKQGIQDSTELHAYFNRRVQQLLAKHGKKMIGWDEVLAPGLANDVVIQSWRGQKSLRDAALKGYRGILSFGYYLDHVRTAAFHYAVDPLGAEAKELDSQHASLILGGEACMWTEYVTDETVDSRLWPRAAAIAERLWSPADVTGTDDMYRRMESISRWLDWTGIQHRSGYERMLERLAGDHSAAPLRVLADSVEAVGIDTRQEVRQYSSFIPLNRLVDAARPESESVRELTEIAGEWLSDPARHHGDIEKLRAVFLEWQANVDLLRPGIADNFLLAEAAPVSENLSKTGTIGLRALQFLEARERPPADWILAVQKEVSEMEQPQAEVVLAAVRPVKALVEAISGPRAVSGRAIDSRAGGRDK